MNPWEKRLRDLSNLLTNCNSTYLNPDLFRMNTNQFLQTARTVTFIIQKNKEKIPDYQLWYSRTVVNAWGSDEVMTWAKDARNVIEKEGDLELNSRLTVTLIFSYLKEEDIAIECGKSELLNAGINTLIRLAQKGLPSGVSDAAAVKIERLWITASLPQWELLHALSYVYARLFDCCLSLAQQFGTALDGTIPNPSQFHTLREEARRVEYIKLNGLNRHTIATVKLDQTDDIPEQLRSAIKTIGETSTKPNSLDDALVFYIKMAELTFEHFGNHVPMLFLLNDSWQPIDRLTTSFSDQTDKFIFWRNIADKVISLKAFGLVWISEFWIRQFEGHEASAIRDMPIVGERLHVFMLAKTGVWKQVQWEVIRASEDAKPTLRLVTESEEWENETPYFILPVTRAMGIPDPSNVGGTNSA